MIEGGYSLDLLVSMVVGFSIKHHWFVCAVHVQDYKTSALLEILETMGLMWLVHVYREGCHWQLYWCYYLFTDSGYFIATDAYLQRITAMFAHQTEKALPSAGPTWKIKPNSKAAMPK